MPEQLPRRARVGFAQRALVDGGVEHAHQVEEHRQPGRRIQVGLEHLVELCTRAGKRLGNCRARLPAGYHVETGKAIHQPAERFVGLLQRVPREAQLLAVVARQQQVSQRRRPEALIDDVFDVVDVAERLGHLLVVDDQVLDVHPEPRERRARGAFALGDLVFVVRENEVDPAGMQIDGRLAEQPQRHRRAFQVPARAPGTQPVIPRRLAGLGRLPQHEVARVVFGVVVAVDASAGLDALLVEARQLAVAGERRDAEVDGAVAAVRVAVFLERVHQFGHGFEIGLVGGSRRVFHRLEPERGGVLAKRLDVLRRVGAQVLAGLLGAENRPVVDVGEVHHLVHPPPAHVLQRAAQHVQADEGAEVADVPAVVDREAAGVHAHRVAHRRDKRLFLAREGVVKAHRLCEEIRRG